MEIVSCLSLSGGGARGLFTAKVLKAFEETANAPAVDRFDLLAGTSIGGIIAIGLAAGVPAAKIHASIAAHAPEIFRRCFLRRGLLLPRYSQEPLRRIVKMLLGKRAEMGLGELDTPLFVTAVDQSSGCSHLFRSRGLAGKEADNVSLLDAALATSAAPTFFPVHEIGGRRYVDGGLATNAPDLLVVSEAIARLDAVSDKVHVLSVGTAGSAMPGKRIVFGGGLFWVLRHRIVELTLAAQEHASTTQADSILGRRYLRVDRMPAAAIPLDAVDKLSELNALADEAVAEAARDPRWSETANRRARRLIAPSST